MRLHLADVVADTAGTVLDGPADDRVFAGVSTDTRTLERGCLYVALRGPRFDGHAFLEAAVDRGAAGLVVERLTGPVGVPVVRVPDTLAALGQLARGVRRRLGLAVLAITGSVGKTTTKEMATALLRAAGQRVLSTPGNWNNRVGLPLTLLGARGDERLAVLELGISEPGEMAQLTALCEPEVALITSVSEVHTEGLGGLPGVAREKLAIAGGLRRGGTLVLPHGHPLLAAPAGVQAATFGWAPGADTVASAWENLGARGSRLRVDGHEVRVSLPGRHNAGNALAAIAAVKALGVDWTAAAAALARLRPAALRGEVLPTPSGAHLYLDCYNANPQAVEAALETLADLAGADRRVAVLGEMRELGTETASAHARAGRAAARAGLAELHLLGPSAALAADAAAAAGLARSSIRIHPDRTALAAALAASLGPGDWVLVKASRSVGLEAVAEHLGARRPTPPGS